jgi:Calcium binding
MRRISMASAKGGRKAKEGQRIPGLTKQRLDELVEEATVDCYNDSEQATGIYTMLEDNLRVPFETEILGAPVTVKGIDINDRDEIVAVCERGGRQQRILLLDLPLPSPPPEGAEWIEAYRHWRGIGE